MAKRQKPVDYLSVQKQAIDHAKNTLSNVNFGLESLTEEDFGKSIKTILTQLALAFTAGYIAAREE